MQIENRPALEVIRLYDDRETLFYCDPPYPHSARGDDAAYGHEMSDQQHTELIETLRDLDGRAAISGYRCPLYDRLLADWRREDAPRKTCPSVKTPRQESLWMNY